MSDNQRLYGLNVPPLADFNRLAKKLAGEKALTWDDKNRDGNITPNEIVPATSYSTVAPPPVETPAAWPQGFESLFGQVSEAYRRERVSKELTLTFWEKMKTPVEDWFRRLPQSVGLTESEKVAYKKGLNLLFQTAPIMHGLYQNQIGYQGPLQNEKPATKEDEELIRRYGHPWCIGDQSPYCVGLASQPERTSGLYPKEGNCDQFNDGLSAFANPFSGIVYENGAFRSVPYATYYREPLQKAAGLLREASKVFGQIPREKLFADHLGAVADAFESNDLFPFQKADDLWRQHGKSDSLVFVRVGPDETGGDGVGDACGSKARFHMNIGLKNFDSQSLVEKYKPYLQQWEDEASALIGNPAWYKRQEAALNLPEFWDVILAVGDDIGGPNGTNIGQTLPNWCGADGLQEPCPRNIMIYVNKTQKAYKSDLMNKYVAPLFHPENRPYFDSRDVDLDSVVLHEITHNVGPQQGKPRPAGDTDFATPLGKWKMTFEEMKAQNGSLLHPASILKAAREKALLGEISQEELAKTENWYRRSFNYNMAWTVKMILRATRNGKFEGNSYSRLAAIEFGMLNELGALQYDAKNGWWKIDYEKSLDAVKIVAQKSLQLYAEGSFEKADAFVRHYIEGEGFKLLHADRINEVAGQAPSVLFDYQAG